MTYDRETLTRQALMCGVPDHCLDGLIDYIVDGIKPGDFLTAVFEDRALSSVASRADNINRHALFTYTVFLASYAPMACWGSPEAVRAWRGTAKMEADHGQV